MKNPDCRNEFANSKKNRRRTPKTYHRQIGQSMTKSPWTRYTLQANRYETHIRDASAQRATPGRAGKIHGNARREHVQAKFSIFELQQKIDVFEKNSSHDRRLGHTKLRRYAFVLRIATANRQQHARKTWENIAGRNEFTDLEKFTLEHPPQTKNDFGHDFGQSPR